jgi:hypothetical protein
MNAEGVISYLSLALAVGGIVIGAINRKRIRSSCCGVEKSVSLDIESTSPRGEKADTIEVTVPRRSERLKEKEEQKESPPTAG